MGRQLQSLRPPADMNAAGRGANLALARVLGLHLACVLALSGYDTAEKVRAASDEELLRVVRADRDVFELIREGVG